MLCIKNGQAHVAFPLSPSHRSPGLNRRAYVRARTLIAFAMLSVSNLALAQNMRPHDVDALPSSPPTLVVAYGKDRLQVGELRLPAGKGPFPVVEVIHGGCWTTGYATRKNTAALATALTGMGYATWNIEYRQVGDFGGGWPGTFQDWSAATDYLRVLAKTQPISLDHVAVVGHSAGAHAALWIASRSKLPRTNEITSKQPLPIAVAVAIDGPGALVPFVGFDAEICKRPVIAPLLGGLPNEQPSRYRLASPIDHLPTSGREYLISSVVLTAEAAEQYRKVAQQKGQIVQVLKVRDGGHFDIIAPGSAAWTAQVQPFLVSALRK
jgi:acetyl esterase/lipase